MKQDYREIEALLPGYLSGDLSDSDRQFIEQWRTGSPENELFFQRSLKAWESLPLLHEMEQFDSFKALKKINLKIANSQKTGWWSSIQRVAAILILPLMLCSGYLLFHSISLMEDQKGNIVMQTISSRQGIVSQIELSDGTKVWLNSGSSLQFPTQFHGASREVKLHGEAFFSVAKNEKLPFRVNAKDLNIEVLGTSFNVVSYDDEKQTEVVLVEGKVKLSTDNKRVEKGLGIMVPGQRSVYDECNETVRSEQVNVDKYISWRDGNLIFRDDIMVDVVKRLSRWFNVDIVINDPEIRSYVYQATFRNESLVQVLNLLKISAPIDYKVTDAKLLPNGEFTKQKIYLMKKMR